jgi:hypothetical protein
MFPPHKKRHFAEIFCHFATPTRIPRLLPPKRPPLTSFSLHPEKKYIKNYCADKKILFFGKKILR